MVRTFTHRPADGFMVLDLCPSTLIDTMRASNFNLDDGVIGHVTACVAAGIAHMHRQSPPMAHR